MNSWIPVPDICSCGSFRVCVDVVSQRFNTAWQCRALCFTPWLGLEPTWRWRSNPWCYMGVILHFSPIWFPFAPPMFSVNHSHRTRRMGTQLIRYCCTVAAKIALYMVHPSSTPDGRYEVGIPNTLLTSQFAVGNCTKKRRKVRIGMKVRILTWWED